MRPDRHDRRVDGRPLRRRPPRRRPVGASRPRYRHDPAPRRRARDSRRRGVGCGRRRQCRGSSPETKTPFVVVCRLSAGGSRHASEPLSFEALCHSARRSLHPRSRWSRCASTAGSATSASAAPARNASLPAVAGGRRPPDRVVGRGSPRDRRGVSLSRRQLRHRGPRLSPPLSERRPRQCGHVLGLTLVAGDLRVDGEHELHVEVPAGMSANPARRRARSTPSKAARRLDVSTN